MNVLTIQSKITSPDCGHSKQEEMPTDVPVFMNAKQYKEVLKPKEEDCCVFGSY